MLAAYTQLVENHVIFKTATDEDFSFLTQINKVEPVGLILDVKDENFFEGLSFKIILGGFLMVKDFPPHFRDIKELMAQFALEYFFFCKDHSNFKPLLELPSPQNPLKQTPLMNVPR